VKIGLKDCGWERIGDSLIVVSLGSRLVELNDPDGSTEALLTALAAGAQTVDELRTRLAATGRPVGARELADALAALDAVPLLDDPDGAAFGDTDLDPRYAGNLAFFEIFSDLRQTPTRLQNRLRNAHVLQLGTGGVGSSVLQGLASLGVGRLTLLDADVVEPRTFARQFLYRRRDVGRSKVEAAAAWLRGFDDRIEVRAVERWVIGPDDVADLLPDVDVVASGIDTPVGVDRWVNQACMAAGVPWVRGGVTGTAANYFSVHPGRSACLACRLRADEKVLTGAGADGASARMAAEAARVNRAVGPMAALAGSLVALEVARYLTGFEPPAAAGTSVTVDVAGGPRVDRSPWPADPSCALCARAGRPGSVLVTA
jgi:molybdopterin/thiamine biosynthesis adenylyltransferase